MHTRKKLDVTLDYLNDDIDTGPSRSRKHDVEAGWWSDEHRGRGHLHETYRAVQGFIESRVGTSWDDAYSELCKRYDRRSEFGYLIHKHSISWGFNGRWRSYEKDENGLLQEYDVYKRRHYRRTAESPREVKWTNTLTFNRDDIKRPAKCGCIHFYHNVAKRYWDTDMRCAHGNKPVIEILWKLVEYGFHDPDEIYSRHWVTNKYSLEKLGLTEPFLETSYYRDHPEKIKYVIRRKSCSKYELKALKLLLAGTYSEPKMKEKHANIRPLNRHKDRRERKRLRAYKIYPQDFSCSNTGYKAETFHVSLRK